MTEEQINEIRARADAATPGPWSKCSANDGRCACGMINAPLPSNGDDPFFFAYRAIDGVATIPMRDEDFRNINFIAHAREDVPALCNEVERLRKALRLAEFVVDNSLGYLPKATGIERDALKFLKTCDGIFPDEEVPMA